MAKVTADDLTAIGLQAIDDSRFYVENIKDINAGLFYIDEEGELNQIRAAKVNAKGGNIKEIGWRTYRYYPSLNAIYAEGRGLFSRDGAILAIGKDVSELYPLQKSDSKRPIFRARVLDNKAGIIIINSDGTHYKWAWLFKGVSHIEESQSGKFIYAIHYHGETPVKVSGVSDAIIMHTFVHVFEIESKKISEMIAVTNGNFRLLYLSDGTVIYDKDNIEPVWELSKEVKAFNQASFQDKYNEVFHIVTADNKHGVINIGAKKVVLPAIYDWITDELSDMIIIGKLDGRAMKWGVYDMNRDAVGTEPVYDMVHIDGTGGICWLRQGGNKLFIYSPAEGRIIPEKDTGSAPKEIFKSKLEH